MQNFKIRGRVNSHCDCDKGELWARDAGGREFFRLIGKESSSCLRTGLVAR